MVKPVSNPPNPWSSTHVEWIGEPPEAKLEVYEEEAKHLIAENDSPDVGFRFGINPYRGCGHGCAYCLSGDTQILMGDATTKALAEVRPGDEIYGTHVRGHYRRYVRTVVRAHWQTLKPAFRVRLDDGTVLLASGDHRFLTDRGWKHVAPSPRRAEQRPFLTVNNRLLGLGPPPAPAPGIEARDYRAGYLCGMIRGDGLLRSYDYSGRRRAHEEHHRFRLALIDGEALGRTREFLADDGILTRSFVSSAASATHREMRAIRTSAKRDVAAIRTRIGWPHDPSDDWQRGYLAGLFDAEGCWSAGIMRISNTDPTIIDRAMVALSRFGFDAIIERKERDGAKPIQTVRIRGGLREHLRFLLIARPVITRKRDFEGVAVKAPIPRGIVAIEDTGVVMPMYDITTGTGDFIANGVISHNCFARPSHQYLGFGAGTDFERRIVVKVNAPEALRRDFLRPSWKGDLVALSGNTDCYQPLEASYRLTRGCLEVFREFRNPVVIITKGLLVRRDVDLLSDLAKVARVSVHVSIPFLDDAMAKALEPGAAAPVRRFDAMKALADAGVPVGISLAPIIPGMNDPHIPELLRRAKDAGATSAFYTLLRLPAEVLPVFTERLTAAFPDRVSKVVSQVKDVRGGKMNDPRFGSRMRSRGPRWDAIVDLFRVHAKRLGLDGDRDDVVRPSTFRRPDEPLPLFPGA